MKKNQETKKENQFGSNSSMINKDLNDVINTELVDEYFQKTILESTGESPDDLVILEDGYGCYVTTKSRLDSGIADPNRYFGFNTPKNSESTSISKTNFDRRKLLATSIINLKDLDILKEAGKFS